MPSGNVFNDSIQMLTEKQTRDAIGATRIGYELGEVIEGVEVQQADIRDSKSAGGRNELANWRVYYDEDQRIAVGQLFRYADASGVVWTLTITRSKEMAGRGIYCAECSATRAKV